MKFVDEVKHAEESVLMLSKKHCHLKNVHSIVYGVRKINEKQCLDRAFLAEEGHSLATNFPSMGMTVGIHNHKYNLTIECIYGLLINEVYNRATGAGFTVKLNRFDFNLDKETLEKKFIKNSEEYLNIIRTEFMSTDRFPSYLRHNELHTVRCQGKTAWKVRELAYLSEYTIMFSDKSEEEVNKQVEGLYVPFSCKDEIVAYVESYFK